MLDFFWDLVLAYPDWSLRHCIYPFFSFILMAKGAPEEIIQRCRTIATDQGEEEIDDEVILDFEV